MMPFKDPVVRRKYDEGRREFRRDYMRRKRALIGKKASALHICQSCNMPMELRYWNKGKCVCIQCVPIV